VFWCIFVKSGANGTDFGAFNPIFGAKEKNDETFMTSFIIFL
jgi:hypothetical protein